jgi:hypothetical protein
VITDYLCISSNFVYAVNLVIKICKMVRNSYVKFVRSKLNYTSQFFLFYKHYDYMHWNIKLSKFGRWWCEAERKITRNHVTLINTINIQRHAPYLLPHVWSLSVQTTSELLIKCKPEKVQYRIFEYGVLFQNAGSSSCWHSAALEIPVNTISLNTDNIQGTCCGNLLQGNHI